MLKVIRRRVLVAIPILVAVSLVTFVFGSLVPGDPARTLLGENATVEQYERLREEMNLNEPLLVQYWEYLQGVVQGDLGRTVFTREDVTAVIADRLPTTLSLMFGAAILATVVGVLLGVWSATGGRFSRRVVDVISLFGSALPSFWIGLILISIFAVSVRWFPATGYVRFTDDPILYAKHLVLPVVALSIGGIAAIAKVARDGMMSALEMDFTRTLRAAGVSERSLIWKHGLRNSSVAIITMVGMTFIRFVAGTVLVETIFALPGLGSLIVDATNRHDVPVVQGVGLVITAVVILVNLITDIIYGILDPKVRTA